MPSSRCASSTGGSSSARWAMTSVSPASAAHGRGARSSSLQLEEVVDLAVEDGGDVPVLVGDRRVAGDEVDDREAVLPDDPPAADEPSPRVRAAVLHCGELGVDHGTEITRPNDPADAAHQTITGCGEAATIGGQSSHASPTHDRSDLRRPMGRACRSGRRAAGVVLVVRSKRGEGLGARRNHMMGSTLRATRSNGGDSRVLPISSTHG